MAGPKETAIRYASETATLLNLFQVPTKFALSPSGQNKLMFFRRIDGGIVVDRRLDLIFDSTNRLVFHFKGNDLRCIFKFQAKLHQDASHRRGNGRQIHALKTISLLSKRRIFGWQRWAQLVDECFWSERQGQLPPRDRNKPTLLIPVLASTTEVRLWIGRGTARVRSGASAAGSLAPGAIGTMAFIAGPWPLWKVAGLAFFQTATFYVKQKIWGRRQYLLYKKSGVEAGLGQEYGRWSAFAYPRRRLLKLMLGASGAV